MTVIDLEKAKNIQKEIGRLKINISQLANMMRFDNFTLTRNKNSNHKLLRGYGVVTYECTLRTDELQSLSNCLVAKLKQCEAELAAL